jgi:hypothetical protein
MKQSDITENQVFSCGDQFRRVVAIHKDMAAYSTGGNKTHYCKLETLRRWVVRNQTKLVNNGGRNGLQNRKGDTQGEAGMGGADSGRADSKRIPPSEPGICGNPPPNMRGILPAGERKGRTGRIHYARIENSPRLQRLDRFLQDGNWHSTREVMRGADVCAVNTAVDELRENGRDVRCERRGRYWYYRMLTNDSPA